MHRTTIQALSMASLFAAVLLGTACGPDYPNCDHDEDCHEGEFCVDGQCQQCRSNADCATGQQCNAGRCDAIPGYCDDNTPCPSGQTCVNNRCQANASLECDPERPCPAGRECINGSCSSIPGYCDDNSPCPGGQRCTNNRCEQLCQYQAVYFEFDSARLDERGRNAISGNRTCHSDRGGSVHIVGHADPRGTEEYNLALGHQRAEAARRYLQSLGVRGATVSSRGEEDATGSDEGSWANDRRAEFTAP